MVRAGFEALRWIVDAAFFVLATSCGAQNIHGDWQASVVDPIHRISERFVLHISDHESAIAASLDVPERFEFADGMDSISFDKPMLRFHSRGASFEGTIAADAQSIEGIWTVGAEKQNLTWQRVGDTPANRMETVALTLRSLMHLPADEWKTHTGDIPHGEAINLDDSSWTIGPNTEGPNEAVWYRRWIEVPQTLHGYDLMGSRIWFVFQVEANGPATQMIYFNGRRVAMGDELELFVWGRFRSPPL